MKKILFVLLLNTLLTGVVASKTIKIAVVAPDGTSMAKSIKQMSKEIKKATNGQIKLKTYYGGSQGDETDVLRKIRIGQLHGGIFTGKTLGDINGDIRIVEIPFTFSHDRKKAWNTLDKMTPFFNKKIEKNNFKNLSFFEIGLVYLVSKKKISRLEELHGAKIWAWQGDPLVAALIEEMKLVSIPLPLPDVLTSLSTGIIDTVYSPPLGILALQWNTKIKYLLDFPLTYSIGAFLIDKKVWDSLDSKYKPVVESICKKYFKKINEDNNRENLESLKFFKESGVEFIKFPDNDYRKIIQVRQELIKALKRKLISDEAFIKLNRIIGK